MLPYIPTDTWYHRAGDITTVTHDMDDFGFWKHSLNEWNTQHIARAFFDKESCLSLFLGKFSPDFPCDPSCSMLLCQTV